MIESHRPLSERGMPRGAAGASQSPETLTLRGLHATHSTAGEAHLARRGTRRGQRANAQSQRPKRPCHKYCMYEADVHICEMSRECGAAPMCALHALLRTGSAVQKENGSIMLDIVIDRTVLCLWPGERDHK